MTVLIKEINITSSAGIQRIKFLPNRKQWAIINATGAPECCVFAPIGCIIHVHYSDRIASYYFVQFLLKKFLGRRLLPVLGAK